MSAPRTGVFACWQPKYAEHGIPTFPVVFYGADKKPAVKGYLNLGLPYSKRLATEFPSSDAFGFALGRRSKITALDIDSQDGRFRDDMFARYGEPAIVVRTLRGRWQGWYRYNGEPRSIKPWPDKPVDLLGGGFTCAPPSKGLRSTYAFVQGDLGALDKLAPLRNLDLPARAGIEGPERVREGIRNNTLWRYCMRQAPHCDDLETLVDVARTFAENQVDMTETTHPVTDAEIRAIAASAWKYEAEDRNLFGRGGALLMQHDQFDALLKNRPARMLSCS